MKHEEPPPRPDDPTTTDDEKRREFVPCPGCSEKEGVVHLCPSCVDNRATIIDLQNQLQQQRDEVRKALGWSGEANWAAMMLACQGGHEADLLLMRCATLLGLEAYDRFLVELPINKLQGQLTASNGALDALASAMTKKGGDDQALLKSLRAFIDYHLATITP